MQLAYTRKATSHFLTSVSKNTGYSSKFRLRKLKYCLNKNESSKQKIELWLDYAIHRVGLALISPHQPVMAYVVPGS